MTLLELTWKVLVLGLDLNQMLGLQLLLLTSMLEVQRKKIEKVELLEKTK
jgi:hypothetical protein